MAFVDFLEPSRPLPTNPNLAPLARHPSTGAAEALGLGGAFNHRLLGKGSKPSGGSGALTPINDEGRFDLRRAVVTKSTQPGQARDEEPLPPPMSPDSAGQGKNRRTSFAGGRNLLSFGRGNSGKPKQAAAPVPAVEVPSPRPASNMKNMSNITKVNSINNASSVSNISSVSNVSNVSTPATSSPQSSVAPSPRGTPSHQLSKCMDLKIQATFERHMNGTVRSGFSTNDTSTSTNSSHNTFPELFGASAPEDEANDAALGAFLAGASARARRQRAAEELLPRSQQLLNQQATRRNRRMSSDSSVCETRPWVDALQGSDVRAKREAAKGLRTALKDGPENRMRLVGSGGVRPLVLALSSPDNETAEHAAAAILFLAMSRDTAVEVVSSGGVKMLVEAVAVEDPLREQARSNAAASLFALSHTDVNRKLIHSQGAIKPLANFLKAAKSKRAKKDACLALFNMALVPQGPEEMVSLGVVERAVELLEEAEEGVEEKAAALLGGLAKNTAGLAEIESNEDALFALAETLEGGTAAAAEHACITLYQLASKHPKLVPKILAEGCLPPLVRVASVSKKGSDARLLLDILRAYCKKKAKEQELEQRKRDSGRGQPSRLSNFASFSAPSGRPPLVDKDAVLKKWSGEPFGAAM